MIIDNIDIGGVDENADYGTGTCINDTQALMENVLYDALSCMNEADRNEYMQTDEFTACLQENGGFVGKKTVVRLNKLDDLSRRIKLAVYQKAKEVNDQDYRNLKKIQAKKHAINSRLMAKYGNMVKRDAIKSQKALIKINPKAFTRTIR